MPSADALAETLGIGLLLALPGAYLLAALLRRRGLRSSWALLGLPVAYVALGHGLLAYAIYGACLLAALLGASWHRQDLEHGADYAEAARERLRIRDVLIRALRRRAIRRGGWIEEGRLVLGEDRRGMPVSIPVGYESGKHSLVLGATGSGKTVSEAWIACRLIEAGHGAVVIDPKGDSMLREELIAAAEQRDARFAEWTPEGPTAYNPYSSGSETEIADKALSGEVFTEPHYLRQAQRYLGHAVRAMQAASIAVTPVSLMASLSPRELEVIARSMPEEQAGETQAYLDSLTERQQRDLAGVRDRLSILAESDARRWVDPGEGRELLEIEAAVRERAVVYFRLDSDRRPLLAAMIAAAIVSDLISLVARLQREPIPTVVAIDEFSAVAAGHTARLFGRARSAGISLLLGTQELADLRAVGSGALREQTLGNISTLIAHRQNVPASAELIAQMAGTTPRWVATQQTEDRLLGSAYSGRGSRRRAHELDVHPSRIKALRAGQALVFAPGDGLATVVRIYAPGRARSQRHGGFARLRASLQRLRLIHRQTRRNA